LRSANNGGEPYNASILEQIYANSTNETSDDENFAHIDILRKSVTSNI
jgi:hypothetical protein